MLDTGSQCRTDISIVCLLWLSLHCPISWKQITCRSKNIIIGLWQSTKTLICWIVILVIWIGTPLAVNMRHGSAGRASSPVQTMAHCSRWYSWQPDNWTSCTPAITCGNGLGTEDAAQHYASLLRNNGCRVRWSYYAIQGRSSCVVCYAWPSIIQTFCCFYYSKNIGICALARLIGRPLVFMHTP